MKQEKIIEKCPCCGASMEKYSQKLTSGLVKTLAKAYKYVIDGNINDFHIYDDLIGEYKLSTTEQMNWTKLRFHGLVAKIKENGEIKRGHWCVTLRGKQFLLGEIEIPNFVITFRNHIEDRSTTLIGVSEVMRKYPNWQTDFRIVKIEPKQEVLL